MPKITFYKEKVEIEVPVGTNLRKAAQEAGVEVYPGVNKVLNCLGNGSCGSCRVLMLKDTVKNTGPRTLIEKIRFATSFLNIGEEENLRLSCQTTVQGDVEVFTKPAFNWTGKPDKLPVGGPWG